jgi:tRNA pseudouridine55 synthase
MFLLIDKPKGITSHDVVDKIRNITKEKKVGHAGTLDPLATGLLILAIGRDSTKKLSGLIKKDKVYEAELTLGVETDTLDSEGKVSSRSNLVVNKDLVIKTLKKFEGDIKQLPPKYSAIKVKGKKAYELAREGKEVKLSLRRVKIYSIDLVKFEYPILKIKTKVSSGTYIRSLARDVGKKLGCGAYLSKLKRTKIGSFSLEGAVSLKDLNNKNWKEYAFSI